MAFAGTETLNIAEYLVDRIAPQALGTLIGDLDPLSDLPVMPTGLQDINNKTKIVRVPKTGGLTANRRSELGNVVDQALSDSKVDIPYIESEATFVIDHAVDDVFNEQWMNLQVQDAINAIVTDIMTYAFEQLQAGAASTIGGNAALDHATFITPKQTLTNNKASRQGRFYYVTPETMAVIMGFTEYVSVFGFEGDARNEQTTNLAGFNMRENIYLPVGTGALGKANLAVASQGVSQVWVPQKPLTTGGQTKISQTANGYTISILFEPIPGSNGASRVTVSTQYGIGAVRPEMIVSVDTNA